MPLGLLCWKAEMNAAALFLSWALSLALCTLSAAGMLLVLLRLLSRCTPRQVPMLETWPTVVTQLPLYNEPAVAERLLRAVAAMVYPAGRHHIQVLDDSTDGTCSIVDSTVRDLQAQGCSIQVLRRVQRTGFKAGALAHGLALHDAEYVAIFDADFLPAFVFLHRMISALADEPRAAFAQARWSHLNASTNGLTLAQAMHIDAHFYVQQTARAQHDLLMNFNGSAGVWRRAAIHDAGGWQADTLTEDLDLSHRAAMRGWRALYLDEVRVPAEIPESWAAYRQQQQRWAQGNTETLLKLAGPLLLTSLPWWKKGVGLLHLAQYLLHPLLVLHCLLTPWLPAVDVMPGQLLMLTALLSSLLPMRTQSLRLTAQQLSAMFLLGTATAWSCSLAVLAAFCGRRSPFLRTPKGHAGCKASDLPWVELGLSLYAAAMVWLHGWQLLPAMIMHLSGGFMVMLFVLRERWLHELLPVSQSTSPASS